MKKMFQFVGFISLLCFSFLYNKEVELVIKNNDKILNQIKLLEEQSIIEPIDAKIIDNTIIPGKKGKKINIDKSYKNMKKINKFDTSLLEYEIIKPKISIKDNKDKFVIKGLNNVSFIFQNVNDDIINLLNKNNIKYSNNCCYTKNKDINTLNNCKKEYTVVPNIIVNDNQYIKVKNELSNGSIILFEKNNIKELPYIINYIKSKGFNIVDIQELLDE